MNKVKSILSILTMLSVSVAFVGGLVAMFNLHRASYTLGICLALFFAWGYLIVWLIERSRNNVP